MLRLLSKSAITHIAGRAPARRKATRQREHPGASFASGDFGCSTFRVTFRINSRFGGVWRLLGWSLSAERGPPKQLLLMPDLCDLPCWEFYFPFYSHPFSALAAVGRIASNVSPFPPSEGWSWDYSELLGIAG